MLLDQLFAGISLATFLERYYLKQPFSLAGANGSLKDLAA